MIGYREINFLTRIKLILDLKRMISQSIEKDMPNECGVEYSGVARPTGEGGVYR